MNIKSAKILPILCCLLAALFLLPANVFSAPPPGPVLTVNVIGSGSVIPSGGIYKKNNMVPIEAIADGGWLFDYWEGDLSGSANPTTIRMTSDKYVTVVFVEEGTGQEYTLTTEVTGKGYVSPPRGVLSGRHQH